jgi:hypothetical protein
VSAFPSWLPFAVLPFVMPVLWVVVGMLLGLVSGWRALSLRWTVHDPDQLPPTQISSARVGLVNYKNALLVGSDEDGLVVGVVIFFRLGHPWLRLPWSAVGVEPPRGRFFPTQVLRLDPAGANVRLRLPGGVAAEVLGPRPLDD